MKVDLLNQQKHHQNHHLIDQTNNINNINQNHPSYFLWEQHNITLFRVS
jgi:hypothetical protein